MGTLGMFHVKHAQSLTGRFWCDLLCSRAIPGISNSGKLSASDEDCHQHENEDHSDDADIGEGDCWKTLTGFTAAIHPIYQQAP